MMKINHLYIHVPFCNSICAYCDFCHVVYRKELVTKWLNRLKEEFNECKNEQYETIYIGGGTPSCLDINELETLLKLIKPHTKKIKEFTIEINPESIDENKVKLFKNYQINRVSIGLQSSNNRLLKLMNRHHSFKDVKNAVSIFKNNGIKNISIDIMYSLPTQTMPELKKTIKDVLSLNVPHLSIYSLTIEENSIFNKKGYQKLDDEIEADMYEYIVDELKKHKYIQYEVANFSKKGYESKHNLGYWHYDNFRGLSCGSSSKIDNIRYDKTKNINDYLNNKNIIVDKIKLNKKEQMFENIMMSLRTNEGLDLKLFNSRYKKDAISVYCDAINKNSNNLIIKNNHLIVKNRAILNTILVDFVE